MAARALEALPVDVQAKAVAALATELGLMDPVAAAAYTKIGELTGLLAAEKITVDEYATGVETIGRYMDELPADVLSEIEVRVTATGDLWILTYTGGGGTTIPLPSQETGQQTGTGATLTTTPPLATTTTPTERGGLQERGQHGLHGIVPPGYSRDNFLIGVQSGEEVEVKTREQQRSDPGGDTTIIIHNHDRTAAAHTFAEIDNMKRKRLNRFMG
jgi:hypothetical protein